MWGCHDTIKKKKKDTKTQQKPYIEFAWQGFSSRGATEDCEDLSEACPVSNGDNTNGLQERRAAALAKAEPASDGGGVSGITYLEGKEKKNVTSQKKL